MIDEAMMLRECIYNLSGQDPQETKAIMQAAASKIDEFRAALQERDAEIQRQYACIASHARITQAAEVKVEEQRKVLEQALEALENWRAFDGSEVDRRLLTKDIANNITAIQEQLK